MKVVLSILCWLLVAYCAYFPYSYFHKEADKKEIKVSHILVKTQEEAEKLKKEIEEGASFEKLAEKHSLCESKAQKGDIGYNTRGFLIPEFEKVAFNLKKGKIPAIVQTEEGWHLVKVTDIKYFSDKDNFERRY